MRPCADIVLCLLIMLTSNVGCVTRSSWQPHDGPRVWIAPDRLSEPVVRTVELHGGFDPWKGPQGGFRVSRWKVVSVDDVRDRIDSRIGSAKGSMNTEPTDPEPVRTANFEIYLVTLDPQIFLLRPHTFVGGSAFGWTLARRDVTTHPHLSQVGDVLHDWEQQHPVPRGYEVSPARFFNRIHFGTAVPISDNLWWWSPELKQPPTPLTSQGRAASIPFDDEVLDVRPEGEQWVTHRRNR